MEETKLVLIEKSNGVAIMTINNPYKRNALYWDNVEEMNRLLCELEDDTDVKVIILTGAGKAFSSGGYIPFLAKTAEDAKLGRGYLKLLIDLITKITTMEKPIIAMVNGVAAGGSFNIAMACDIVFCAKSAKFTQSFIKIGIIPDCGGHYFLPRIVGIHKAKELMFTGDMIDADEALRLGIVNRVVEDKDLREATIKFAESLTDTAPYCFAYIKKILNNNGNLSMENIFELEASYQFSIPVQDIKNKMSAFMEKLKPA